ncbi:MAG: acetate kinase [Comamonadaceae bacterium]|nr:MAG: acetate kinase [Comamonadaceae bacterium]
MFDFAKSQAPVYNGLIEKIGTPSKVSISFNDRTQRQHFEIAPCAHRQAIEWLIAKFGELGITATLDGVGHRFVHGGERFKTSTLITPELMTALKACLDLAPLHNPANYEGVELMQKALPQLPQCVVFDTAFHATLPDYAYRYALPEKYYLEHQIRRYGFHGTSHSFIAQKAGQVLAQQSLPSSGLISLHLGNGCSSCAIWDGKSVDTSMGFTPLEGLVMGTRSGDIDPGVCIYLAEKCQMTAQEMSDLLNKKSGLLGVSGVSNDLRTLLEKEQEGHRPSLLALNMFAYKVAQSVGKMMVALARLDAIIFTGGIGENSALMRARIVHHLQCFGLTLDDAANASHGKTADGLIQGPNSRAKILVIPTQEEWLIAQETAKLIGVAQPA